MSRIPQDFIDELLNRIDIVDVIDSRVKLKKTGKNYSACCPFHKEKTPSFSVSPDKQFYYCFGCGASGTALGFVMEYEHLGFVDAVESLAGNAGLSVPRERTDNKQHKTYQNLYTILDKANHYYQQQLAENPQRKEAVTYLKNRGLSGGIAKQFGVGYAPPGWDNLMRKFGLSEQERKLLAEAGLSIENEESGKRYDRFRQRIMFPIIDVRGRTIGFGGRILANDKEPQQAGGKSRAAGPKYLNSPETPVFHKGRELYGLFQALQNTRKLEQLLVVEGYMDVIALAQYGINNAVATLGTACGEEHLKLAFRYSNEIIFCFDGDNAGRKAAKRALENALPTMKDGRHIKFLFLPEGQDPDSMVRQVGTDRFQEQLQSALPLEDFFFDAIAEGIDTRTMEGRARMSKLAAPLLHQLPNGIYRELMFEALAQRTGLSLDILQELIKETPRSLTPAQPAADTGEREQSPKIESVAAPPEPQSNTAPAWRHITETPPPPPGRTRLSLSRLATTLLLENPELLTDDLDVSLPEVIDKPELEQLKLLLQFLKERPQSKFHSILGHWGGQYGMSAQNYLTSLVASQFLGSAKKTASYDGRRELQDALQRIRQEHLLAQTDRELAELSSLATLNDEQKARHRELLQTKQQMKMTKH